MRNTSHNTSKPEQKLRFFKSRTWITIMFLAGVLLLGIGLVQMTPSGGNVATAYISAGTVLMIFAGLRLYRGEKNYLQDERTKKIGAYGLSWSWFLTIMVLFVIFWSYYLHIWTPDAGTLCVILILIMGISAKAFQMWFFRKGDVA
jgi:peptidoglycan/LPS O-acetylase OafA/YrhL